MTWIRGMLLRTPYIGPSPAPGFGRSCWGLGPPGPPGMSLEIPLGCFLAYWKGSLQDTARNIPSWRASTCIWQDLLSSFLSGNNAVRRVAGWRRYVYGCGIHGYWFIKME